MPVWKIIKEKFTQNKTPGSAGYHAQSVIAAELYTDLLPFLKAPKQEEKEFNADAELTKSLLMSNSLAQMGLLKRRD
jgi:hypothetical protein